jgi:undecaprenyl-diphosphatase
MDFLYFLESIRNGFLDAFFSVITLCGEETVFMAVGMIIFWCVCKYQGYYLLCVGFLGTLLNQFLKMLFRIPRPWIKDPSFTIVESARDAASGYSFPSGHTQTSVGLFGGLARWNKNLAIRIIGISLCVLVPLSRMYLGVHTPADVGVSICIAALLIFLVYPLFKKATD